jgi:nucleotide-binding universal stress UspA family protein
VETIVEPGAPAETLAELAKAGEVDLVVVGHRGRNALSRALMGSVADRLVQICSKPVLVVR